MPQSKTSTSRSLNSWSRILLFTTAVILVNWLVGGSGYFLYQWYQSSISQPGNSISQPGNSISQPSLTINDAEGDARYWVERIRSGDGAFILYFRHAEREKWPLVAVYDYFEVSESVDGSQQSYAAAVCLSERGKEDARLIGQVFDKAGITVAKVLSSPSCRARETASTAFGRINVTDRALLSGGAVGIKFDPESAGNLIDLLIRNSPELGETVAVVGHSHTLETKTDELFPDLTLEIPELNESGFYVIEVVEGKLVPRWAFVDFTDFAHELLVY
jgi:phosphohistidine phosphatase SixA